MFYFHHTDRNHSIKSHIVTLNSLKTRMLIYVLDFLNAHIKSVFAKYSVYVYSTNYLYGNLLFTNIAVIYGLCSLQSYFSYIVEMICMGEWNRSIQRPTCWIVLTSFMYGSYIDTWAEFELTNLAIHAVIAQIQCCRCTFNYHECNLWRDIGYMFIMNTCVTKTLFTNIRHDFVISTFSFW